ncbi:hypothetical protein [Tomitella biformata]|uniref:hypothetical protein n=1 Tax=Tomitella biformata TaxID=630403 RepID=UPI00046468A8|nr:hypothetical protein [Tomitella biformata]
MHPTRTATRALHACVIAFGLAITLTACGSDDSAADTATPTATASQPDATTPSATTSPNATSPAATDPSASPAPEPSTGTSTARPAPPTRDDANVDARDFQSGPAFYFQSPSGNIMCGVYPDDPQLGVGCQASDAPVSTDGPPCENSATSAVGIKLAGGNAQRICLNQGIYVGPPVDGTNRGGGKVLAYGDTIIVQSVACQSTEAGITCWGPGGGFTLSRDVNEVF